VSDEKNPNIRYQGLEFDGFVAAMNGVEAWVPRDFRRTGFDLDVVVELGEKHGGRSGHFAWHLRGRFFPLGLFYGDINIAGEGRKLVNVER
jgi:hypothetical protein